MRLPRLTETQIKQQADAAIELMRRGGDLYAWWRSKGFSPRERARIEKAIEAREIKTCRH